jgi:hypothetical protein
MEGGGPDPRCYRVNCDKLTRHIPGFKTEWTVRRGAEELYDSFEEHGVAKEWFAGYGRLKRIQELLASGRLDETLRAKSAPATV